ncbi:MAG: hypothetical protein HGB36_09410 [Chlorobiaceae bacterium]|nr:hypothetical protein [Chlorobiaceae bacterium]
MNALRLFSKTIRIALLLLLSTISTMPASFGAQTAQPASAQEKQPDRNELIYALHHEIIPGILFSDKGSLLFNDLFSGKTGPFIEMVEGPLGKAYASEMKFSAEHGKNLDIVLISFPIPSAEPQNHHAALVRINGSFRYITLEKGNDAGNTGMKAFFCEWNAEHKHLNYGPRKYDDLASFRKELLDFLKK